MLNVTADHLDRYASIAAYARAKERIFAKASTVVLNARRPARGRHARTRTGASRMAGPRRPLRPPAHASSPFPPAGRTRCATPRLGFPPTTAPPISRCCSRERRLSWRAAGRRPDAAARHRAHEDLRVAQCRQRIGGARAWARQRVSPLPAMLADARDLSRASSTARHGSPMSRACATSTTRKARTSARPWRQSPACRGPLVLIAGGEGKGQDFTPLAAAFRGKVRHAVLIGKDARGRRGGAARRLHDRARARRSKARCKPPLPRRAPGETVLLSPACASFDMFRDYGHRGESSPPSAHAPRRRYE